MILFHKLFSIHPVHVQLKFDVSNLILGILVSCVLLGAIGCTINPGERQVKYFVHSTGDDGNAGTTNDPFRTIHKLQSIDFEPGDSIFLQANTTHSGTLRLTLVGTSDAPIVITSYGDGRATIDGGSSEACIVNGSWFHIKDIDLLGEGRKSGNTSSGLVIDNGSHVMIDGIKSSGFQKNGLLVQNSSDVNITNVHAIRNGAIGISVHNAENCVISDCLAENNPGDPTNLTNHSGNGILVGESKNILVDHCVATNNGWDMPRKGNGPVGIWGYQSDSLIIQYCIAYRNKTSDGGKDGGGFDFDGGITNSIIQYCLSYENEGAGIGLFQYPGADNWSNNIIRYNISINDARTTDGAGGIFVWNGGQSASEVSNCYIHNNLIINEWKPAVVFEPASEHINFNFNNNIFIGAGNIVEGPTSGDSFLANVWHHVSQSDITFRGYQDLENWANATGQETLNGKLLGMQIDPMLMGPLHTTITDPYELKQLFAFQLQSISPVIDKGVALKGLYHLSKSFIDFYGNPAPSGLSFEPGVFELQD